MDDLKYRVTFLPAGVEGDARVGETVSAVAARVGVPLSRHCGGARKCGKCRIKVTGEGLSELTETEKALLSRQETFEGIRLACCASIVGDCDVLIVDRVEQEGNKLLRSIDSNIFIDWAPDFTRYGIAVDIGTTSIVCFLVDAQGRKIQDQISLLNPQVIFGDDVISRIAYSDSDAGALRQMQEVLVRGMNDAFKELTKRNGIVVGDISQIVVAANTVMEHLLMGVSPRGIGRSPYRPEFLTLPIQQPYSVGFETAQDATLKLIPNVAGYVGGDIVAGVEAMRMPNDNAVRLLIDIGTNNEIVLGNKESLFCCAAAAGPALEGARIECGMRAGVGAIERFFIEENLRYDVIGDVAPVGLCGSGLVSILALLLDLGIVEKSGRINERKAMSHPFFKDRTSRCQKGILRLLIAEGDRSVFLTQKDIREVQLAVGAIRVGVEVLLEKMQIDIAHVEEILLAGAFGNYLDVPNAVTIGLLPDVPLERIRSVLNTAGLGACMALASVDFYESTQKTAQEMHYVELSSLPDFQRRFVNALNF